jgi:hypothetical protein
LVGLRALGLSQGRLDLDASTRKWHRTEVKLGHLTLRRWAPKPDSKPTVPNPPMNQVRVAPALSTCTRAHPR